MTYSTTPCGEKDYKDRKDGSLSAPYWKHRDICVDCFEEVVYGNTTFMGETKQPWYIRLLNWIRG